MSLLDASRHTIFRIQHIPEARLAQPVERKALNLVVVGLSPTVGVTTKLCVCLPLLAFVISGWLPDFLQPEYVLTQLLGRLILRALSCCVPPAVIDIAGLATAWHSSLAARQRQEGGNKVRRLCWMSRGVCSQESSLSRSPPSSAGRAQGP